MSFAGFQSSLVSIGVPAYNSEQRIRRVLDSLLSQTYPHIEIILSDDGSRDATYAIAQEYAEKDSRVRAVRQEKNLGHVENFIFVLREARGEYFMWAADDDIRHPESVQKLLDALDAHPECDVAMSSYRNVDDRGNVQNTVLFPEADNLSRSGHVSLYTKMIAGKPIHHFFYGLHRRKKIQEFFYRPPPRCIRWDRVFMAEVALARRFVSVPDVLWFKQVSPVSIAERNKHDPVGKVYADPHAYTRYVWMLLARPMTSRLIPLSRKLFVPFLWLHVAWMYKRKILQEVCARIFH